MFKLSPSQSPAVATTSGQAGIDLDLDEELVGESRDPPWIPVGTQRNLQRYTQQNRLPPTNVSSPADNLDVIDQTFLPVPNHLLISYNTKDEGVLALRGWAERNRFKLWIGGGSSTYTYLRCSRLRRSPPCSYQVNLYSDGYGKWQVVTVCDVHNHSVTVDNSAAPGLDRRGYSTAQSEASLATDLHRNTVSLRIPQTQQQDEWPQHSGQQQQLGQPRRQQSEQTASQQQQRAHLQHHGTLPVRVQQQLSGQRQQQRSRSKRPRSGSNHMQPAEVGHASAAVSRPENQASASSIAAVDQRQPDQQVGRLATSRPFAGIDIDRLEQTASGLGLRELIDLSAQIKYVDKLIEQRLRGL